MPPTDSKPCSAISTWYQQNIRPARLLDGEARVDALRLKLPQCNAPTSRNDDLQGSCVTVLEKRTCLARPASTPCASSCRTVTYASRPGDVPSSASSAGPAATPKTSCHPIHVYACGHPPCFSGDWMRVKQHSSMACTEANCLPRLFGNLATAPLPQPGDTLRHTPFPGTHRRGGAQMLSPAAAPTLYAPSRARAAPARRSPARPTLPPRPRRPRPQEPGDVNNVHWCPDIAQCGRSTAPRRPPG